MGDSKRVGSFGALPRDFFRPMRTNALFFPYRKAQDKSIADRLVAFYR
jgi:hypothetical protein